MSYAKIIKARKSMSPISMMDEMPAPSIHISSKDYEEIKDWKVGQKYNIQFKMTSRTEDKDGTISGNFELVGEGSESPKEKAAEMKGMMES